MQVIVIPWASIQGWDSTRRRPEPVRELPLSDTFHLQGRTSARIQAMSDVAMSEGAGLERRRTGQGETERRREGA